MRTALSLVLVFCATANAVAQDYRYEWSGFKEGSWVKLYQLKAVSNGVYDWETKEAVKSSTQDEVVVTTQTLSPGSNKAPAESKFTLLGLPGSTMNSGKRAGKEDVECEGKKFACTIWEYGAGGSTTKTWECADVKIPGGALRLERISSVDGGAVRTTRRILKLAEPVKVGEKELKCSVFEETYLSPTTQYEGKVWFHADVPGFQVKAELSITAPGKKGSNILNVELREFERK